MTTQTGPVGLLVISHADRTEPQLRKLRDTVRRCVRKPADGKKSRSKN